MPFYPVELIRGIVPPYEHFPSYEHFVPRASSSCSCFDLCVGLGQAFGQVVRSWQKRIVRPGSKPTRAEVSEYRAKIETWIVARFP